MLFDFFAHLNSNDMNDYLNGYSTFLMTNKDLRENVLYHRMNVLINAYLNDKRIGNKCDYLSYYMNNYKDGYLDREFIKDLYKSIDTTTIHDFDGDVIDHYRFITSKPPPEPVIDYDEIDKKFYDEELLKKKESEREVIFDDEIDEDYDDYDYEYYYNDDYDDIEELDDYSY
jgi:hypothetical protein